MDSFIMTFFTTDFGFTILRITTPILFAAMAAIISNKAGVTNIALEGIMLTAALLGVIGSGYTQNIWIGLLCGIIGGVFIALMLVFFSLYLKTDIVLAGVALNMLAIGGTVFVLNMVSGDKSQSTNIPSLVFPSIDIPILKDIPVLGPILSGHNVLTYVAFLSVALIYIFLYKTPLGVRIRSIGENKDAAASVGINVRRLQILALVLSGIIASLGGMYMSMGYLSSFSKNMVAGRGYIAMAAEAMGQSSPVATMFSSMFFGMSESIAIKLSATNVPSQLVSAIPYIATILGLVVYSIFVKKKALKRKKMVEVNNE